MSGFCADCGQTLDGDLCPSGHTQVEVVRPGGRAIDLPRASPTRRLAGSGVEYFAYLAGITAMAVVSALTLGLLDILLVPFLALFIAVRDVRAGRYSLAKRIGNMRVVQVGTGLPASDRQALVRNSYYIVLALLMMMPIFLDTFAATLFWGCVVVDTLMVVGSSHGRRMGDRLAGTQVVPARVK